MRKGQTALEYLMTYGWAILIVIIVVAALYALGLTKPCRWVGTQVREFPDFRVRDPKFDSNGQLTFYLERLKPEQVNITKVIYNGTGYTGANTTLQLPLASGESKLIIVPKETGTAPNPGDCYSVDVKIEYTVIDTGAALTTYGKISGVVA